MNFQAFEQFKYFGIYVFAFTNKFGEVKKSCFQPPSTQYAKEKHYLNLILGEGHLYEHNGIQILTNESNISCIDVDKPEKCVILPRLLEDCKFYVKTRKGYHFYFNKENVLPRARQLDVVDVNTNLWYVPTYRHNETNEAYHYEIVKSEELVDMPQYAIDYIITLIGFVGVAKKGIKNKAVMNNIFRDPGYTVEKIPVEDMKVIFDIFYENKYFETTKKWLSVACMARNSNNSHGVCKMFDEYSRKVKNYAENKYEANRSTFYGKGDYYECYNIRALLLTCKKLDKEKFKAHLQQYLKPRYDHLIKKFDQEFIWNDENTKMFDSFVSSDTKVMTVKASYGLGKTFAFKKLLENYFEGKRVLFLTYRKSLAVAFTNDLKERFGFESYLDKSVNVAESNRLIIQLDSIKHLREYDELSQTLSIPSYDLVVMDEVEGLLSHFSYEKIDQEYIFNILKNILDKSPKILALDGDMGDRAYDFYTGLKYNCEFYENIRSPVSKNFIFTQDKDKWLTDIDNELKENLKTAKGKGIAIVCMTMTQTEELFEKYKDTYKVALHNSIEKNADILSDVNVKWTECDIVIYSPTVEAGVDFNIKDKFSACFASVSDASTCVRAFHQMLNRVRNFDSHHIVVNVPENMKFEVESYLVYFEELKTNKYQNIEIDTLTTILIHNEVERINSREHFISTLVRSLLEKGHTYIFLADKPDKKDKSTAGETQLSQKDKMMEAIVEAKDITFIKYERLTSIQKKNGELTREQKAKVDKFVYKKVFHIETLTADIMKSCYRKFDVLKNYKRITQQRKAFETMKRLKFLNYEACNSILELLDVFGCNIADGKLIKKVEHKFFSDIQADILKVVNTKLFSQRLGTNTFIKEDSSYASISRKLQTVLESFGFAFESTRHQKRNGDKKENYYTVSVGLSKFISEYLGRVGSSKQGEECLIFTKDYTHDEMFEMIKQHFPTNVKTGTYIIENIKDIETNTSLVKQIFSELQYDGLIQE
jgi:hypothetical protein